VTTFLFILRPPIQIAGETSRPSKRISSFSKHYFSFQFSPFLSGGPSILIQIGFSDPVEFRTYPTQFKIFFKFFYFFAYFQIRRLIDKMEGCCESMVKYFMFIINFLFALGKYRYRYLYRYRYRYLTYFSFLEPEKVAVVSKV
jgi:hypothetical protein